MDVNACFAEGALHTKLPPGILRRLEACRALYRMTSSVVTDQDEVQVIAADRAEHSQHRLPSRGGSRYSPSGPEGEGVVIQRIDDACIEAGISP